MNNTTAQYFRDTLSIFLVGRSHANPKHITQHENSEYKFKDICSTKAIQLLHRPKTTSGIDKFLDK